MARVVSRFSSSRMSNVELTLYSAKAIIATSNNMKLVHWPLMGGLLHLV